MRKSAQKGDTVFNNGILKENYMYGRESVYVQSTAPILIAGVSSDPATVLSGLPPWLGDRAYPLLGLY